MQTDSYQGAVPEHGQQGGPSEAAGELLQVCISQPLTLGNQRDPAGGSVTFPVHTAHDARRETLEQPHQTRLHARRHTLNISVNIQRHIHALCSKQICDITLLSGTCAFHYCVDSAERASQVLNDRL